MGQGRDVVLIGTGLAPLLAAKLIEEQGLSTAVLNPDSDFFLEDLELPFDPEMARDVARLSRAQWERAISVAVPPFPGDVRRWLSPQDGSIKDFASPTLRARHWIWVWVDRLEGWSAFDQLYVEAADAKLNPQMLEGVLATHRFPGASRKHPDVESLRGLMIPRLADLDVIAYRRGLLEFVRERVGFEDVWVNAHPIEVTSAGVSYLRGGLPDVVEAKRVLIFWSPRLRSWLEKSFARIPAPDEMSTWEKWELVSRDPVDPGVVGVYKNLVVWAEAETGSVSVIRKSEDAIGMSERSFEDLASLSSELLGWEKFSVRNVSVRSHGVWKRPQIRQVKKFSAKDPLARVDVAFGGEGPLLEVIERVSGWVKSYLEEGAER
jgi:hypothetical protein